MVAADQPHTMKEQITSALRHALTFLPALGIFFASKGWLTPAEGEVLDQELANTLSVLSGLAGAAVSRLLMFLIAKHAPALSNIFGGGSGGSLPLWAITAAAWGALSMAGAFSMSSCVVGADDQGNYTLRPDPRTMDAALRYLIRHEEDEGEKGGMTTWEYYDATSGEKIEPGDYAAYGIEERR